MLEPYASPGPVLGHRYMSNGFPGPVAAGTTWQGNRGLDKARGEK